MPRGQLAALQDERLVKQVKNVWENVAPYRKKMEEAGLRPSDIKGVRDLHKLPFTVKTDLRDNYPFGLFAVAKDKIARIHASSGTTGKMTVVGYTQYDLDVWSELMARALAGAGMGRGNIVHVAYGYGLFTGGLGAHMGAERLGAAVVPASSGNTARQITLIMDFGAEALCCTPSYAAYIADEMKKAGIKPSQIPLRAGVFGAEPWTEGMRRSIETDLGIKAYDVYGLSEIMGPGVSIECEQQDGMHVWEDHFIPEIIDPDTLEPLPYGETGELVFTTITKEGLPLMRYRTRDLCRLDVTPCKCGRTHVRMGKVKGRSDDMLIIRGVNVFPSQIETVLLSMEEVSPHYQIVVDRINNTDILEVLIELNDAMFADTVKTVEKLKSRLESRLTSALGISPIVRLVEPRTLKRSEGKAQRVIDKRNI
jgi:phenylacetate-CoA ligase